VTVPIQASTVAVATPDGPMDVYDAQPRTPDAGTHTASDGVAGGVIVVQEAFGVNDHIEDVTRRFADVGYRAVAPHVFHRTGDPPLSYDDLPPVLEHMKALSTETLLADVDACLDYLASAADLPAGRVAIVGFCMGGSVAALVAAQRRLGAAVSFYGGGVAEGRFGAPPLIELGPQFVTPWLGLYGGQDKGIPVDQAEALRDAAATAEVPTSFTLYPSAQHGFHCDARPDAYDPGAAKDAWQRTLDWFAEHIAQPR
jgi:carboxymethylenebutenolidase